MYVFVEIEVLCRIMRLLIMILAERSSFFEPPIFALISCFDVFVDGLTCVLRFMEMRDDLVKFVSVCFVKI